eukprot:8848664-Pyramimonas_sp.AAC.2
MGAPYLLDPEWQAEGSLRASFEINDLPTAKLEVRVLNADNFTWTAMETHGKGWVSFIPWHVCPGYGNHSCDADKRSELIINKMNHRDARCNWLLHYPDYLAAMLHCSLAFGWKINCLCSNPEDPSTFDLPKVLY